MSVETRFLIERVVHREHGSWCSSMNISSYCVAFGHRPLDEGQLDPFPSVVFFCVLAFFQDA